METAKQSIDRREGLHPDLLLVLEPEHRSIVCVVLPKADITWANTMPFYRYDDDSGLTVFLFENIENYVEFKQEVEIALSQADLVAGLSGPFALSVSARGCAVKARLALEAGLQGTSDVHLHTMAEHAETALLMACRQALLETGFCGADFYDETLE